MQDGLFLKEGTVLKIFNLEVELLHRNNSDLVIMKQISLITV